MGVQSSRIFVLPQAKPLLGKSVVWNPKYLGLECLPLRDIEKILWLQDLTKLRQVLVTLVFIFKHS